MGLNLSNMFKRRTPEETSFAPPIFRSPFTDMTGSIGLHSVGPCMMFNLRWMDCQEAYGPIMSKQKCRDLYEDFNECSRQFKQLHRVQQMRQEKSRQWFMGVLGKGPKTEWRDPNPPSYDTFLPDFDRIDP